MTMQEIIAKLDAFWAKQGALIAQPYGIEVGAGTANPMTFLRVLGPEPFNVAYVEPSRRPADGRYGLSPNRFQHYFQYQVILKPAPAFNQELYLDLLKQLGIDNTKHDLRFVEDNWESPPIGAWGLGWEIWCDGMEITQYTYFQQVAGIPLDEPALEITFGLERMAMYIQGVDDYHQLKWNDDLTVADLFEQHEFWQSKHNYETANVEEAQKRFASYQGEVEHHLREKNYWVAYDYLLKMSHTFNILDARGVVSVSDRTARFAQMGKYANQIGKLYVAERKTLQHPFTKKVQPVYYDLPQVVPAKLSKAKPTGHTYLLEIGLEELPAEYLQKWIKVLSAGQEYGDTDTWLNQKLDQASWNRAQAHLWFTPRRIVIQLTEPEVTKKEITTVRGPLKELCYQNGKTTAILEGFLKKNQATRKDLKEIDNNGRTIVVIERTQTVKLETAIQTIVDELLKTAPATRWMRWDSNPRHVFIRPVRWIVSYYDQKVIPVTLFDITPGDFTCPARFGPMNKVSMHSAQEYLAYIKQQGIVLDHRQRYVHVTKAIPYAIKPGSSAATLVWENVFLTEAPHVSEQNVDKKYAVLPIELIQKILEKNQRYLVDHDASNHIDHYFIIANHPKVSQTITEGNAAVVKARLEDGLFYFNADRQKKLVDWQEGLSRIAFHPKAGSYLDKVKRLESLVQWAEENLPKDLRLDFGYIRQALPLLKNDRATNLGKEFPQLEGVIGAKYAQLEKYPKPVQEIIRGQYQTEGISAEASLMSLLDKVDTLVTLASVEPLPDGSHDPYQLRQVVYSLLALFNAQRRDWNTSIDLWPVIQEAYDQQAVDPVSTVEDLKTFVTSRAYQLYRQETEYDWLAQSLANATNGYFTHKAVLLTKLNQQDVSALSKIFDSLKRVHNMLKQLHNDHALGLDGELDTMLFESDSEQILANWVKKNVRLLTFDEMMKLFTTLDGFFSETMVMAKNTEVRQNRGRLLDQLQKLLQYNLSYQP